jgi:hypothetical protein
MKQSMHYLQNELEICNPDNFFNTVKIYACLLYFPYFDILWEKVSVQCAIQVLSEIVPCSQVSCWYS